GRLLLAEIAPRLASGQRSRPLDGRDSARGLSAGRGGLPATLAWQAHLAIASGNSDAGGKNLAPRLRVFVRARPRMDVVAGLRCLGRWGGAADCRMGDSGCAVSAFAWGRDSLDACDGKPVCRHLCDAGGLY